jgi:hypothetical protein
MISAPEIYSTGRSAQAENCDAEQAELLKAVEIYSGTQHGRLCAIPGKALDFRMQTLDCGLLSRKALQGSDIH